MKTSDVEALLRAHFRAQVVAARDRAPDFVHDEPSDGRTWWHWLAAAATLVSLPVFMLVASPKVSPLADAIDARWNSGGRQTVESVLRSAHEFAVEVTEARRTE